jgi:hypothetical protein
MKTWQKSSTSQNNSTKLVIGTPPGAYVGKHKFTQLESFYPELTLLFVGTFATDDPTRASMPFIVASGALDRGHQPMIVLMGEAVYLLKEGVAESVHGMGFPPLSQPLAKILEHRVPIYV